MLTSPDTLGITATEIGLIASVYLVGQMIGALVFGRLSDQLERRRLLMVTLQLLRSHRVLTPPARRRVPPG